MYIQKSQFYYKDIPHYSKWWQRNWNGVVPLLKYHTI